MLPCYFWFRKLSFGNKMKCILLKHLQPFAYLQFNIMDHQQLKDSY